MLVLWDGPSNLLGPMRPALKGRHILSVECGEDVFMREIASQRPRGAWLKRLGLLGFLFFLGKGILWLVVLGLSIKIGIQ